MSAYLEKAAELLQKAAETNEHTHRNMPTTLNQGRERIAKQFALLGAIDLGVLPISVAENLAADLAATGHRPTREED